MDFLKDFLYKKKFSTNELLILNDESPLDDCGNRFNWVYIVAAAASLIVTILMLINGIESFTFAEIFLVLFLFWGSAWGFKMKLCGSTFFRFRDAKFAIKRKYPLVELFAMISPTLKKQGLTLGMDKNAIVVSSSRTKYEVSYLEDQNGFQVYWYKTLVKAFLSFDNIILYREISETTALIAYVIQCVTGTNDYGKEHQALNAVQNNTNVVQNNTSGNTASVNSDFRECPSCHKMIQMNSKFCKYCGKSV